MIKFFHDLLDITVFGYTVHYYLKQEQHFQKCLKMSSKESLNFHQNLK